MSVFDMEPDAAVVCIEPDVLRIVFVFTELLWPLSRDVDEYAL